LAFEYRNKFRKDVILDVITYRRWGHNELDEPAFTQPLMYKNIRSRKSVPKAYEEKLLTEKVLADQEEIDEFRRVYMQKLDTHLENSRSFKPEADYLRGKWSALTHPTEAISRMDTGVDSAILNEIGNASVNTPDRFSVHPRLMKHHVEARQKMMATGQNIDWATAEALALGSLLKEGYNVRISGQDVGRGTFSQRHCMLVDQESEETYVPLNNMSPDQPGKLEVANSSLSEFAVLGFEYGMSLETPNNLNLWEAQFGDFFNGAQVIIDTYLNSGEQKWLRQSALTLLLPHGYDGAGPEHSSCRVERFLQCSDDRFSGTDASPFNINWHIINPTTPSQYFHALRRQLKRPYRKPLIVVAPKTLLKLSAAVSNIDDMVAGTSFEPILFEPTLQSPEEVEKVVFMSGKMYYDLVKAKEENNVGDKIALVRLEELCPFPRDGLLRTIPYFPNAKGFPFFRLSVT
jgi:probable 2-oxoglutarate dehydrogenase E1 component DHKTD1